MLSFHSAKTWAQVTIHHGALEACLQKKLLQGIKEDGFVRPGELLFFEKQSLPQVTESFVLVQHARFGAVAQEHLAHDRLETPQAPLFAKIDALEPAGIPLQRVSENTKILA